MYEKQTWHDETRTQKIKMSSPNEQGYCTVEDVIFTGDGQEGEPVNAARLNHIEEGIYNLNAFGDIKLTARANAPAGWLVCDGTPVSRTTYALLFEAIGTTYGVGDGATTFNLPNLCGRVPVGLDSTQAEFSEIGKTGGEKAHANTANENGPHAHEIAGVPVISQWHTQGSTGPSCETTTTLVTKSSGLGTPHNNLQPYTTLNYIIYAGQEG